MLRLRPLTPGKGVIAGINAPSMEQAIELKYSLRKAKSSLCWGMLNVILLAVIIYDLAYKCPLYTTTFNYIEYALAVVFSLNVLYHIIRYFFLVITMEPISVMTTEKKEIFHEVTLQESTVGQLTTNHATTSTTNVMNHLRPRTPEQTPSNLNTSAFNSSWRSDSQNESQNYSMSSPSWVFYRGSPEQQYVSATTPPRITYSDVSTIITDDDCIADEKMLKQYLYDYDINEKVQNTNSLNEPQTNLLSTFWAHPSTQTQHEVSMYLRKNQYQLSHSGSATTVATTGTKDEGSPLNVAQRGNECWKKLQIDPQTLTQWNANLRMWISQTIIERLIDEIDNINEEFQNHHLQDVQIGFVGLERLRKTTQTILALQYVPTLTSLLPFLEATTNQEYLVKRLRELSKGGCMSEFKWNSGGFYNGKDWDECLPTDSAIIMHILSTYLDSQLLPLPSQPEAKPFSKEHYIKMNEKIASSQSTLAINQVMDKPPHFRLIVGEEVYELPKGHNNLFHTILLFLCFIKERECGMLGKVNMGKSGVNMLWIIDS